MKKSILTTTVMVLIFFVFSCTKDSLNNPITANGSGNELLTNKADLQTDCDKPFHLVVLGSSTAYGNGASPGNGWVALYTSYLKSINANYIIDNLAVPATTTYSMQGDHYIPPKGRPAPLKGHNITAAINLNADAIIINFPTNDAASYFTFKEQVNNYLRVTNIAKSHHILVWVAGPQPRNYFDSAQVKRQKNLNNWIKTYYKEKFIDFHTGLASAKDSILYKYNAGDGIHLNDAGHKILYQRVIKEDIPDSLCERDEAIQTRF